MFNRNPNRGNTVTGRIYGVDIELTGSNRRALRILQDALPAPWQEDREAQPTVSFGLSTTDGQSYELSRDNAIAMTDTADAVSVWFERMVRLQVALNAPDHVFIHAGVVAHDGRAIVIPGQSFSGKTSLVKALVEAGATYYSDEFAVLGEDGLAYPYAKPLGVRTEGQPRAYTDPAELGGEVGVEPVPIGLVLLTHYRIGAQWEPVALSRSEAVLELLPHTFALHERPKQTLASLGHAVSGAVTLKGDRGGAAALAPTLLAQLTT